MSVLPPARAIAELAGPVDPARLAALREQACPVVLRGLVADWPLVAEARRGDRALVAYLSREPTARPVRAIMAPPSARGRFFYNEGLTGFNFQPGQGRLETLLQDLLTAGDVTDPPAMAVQSEDLAELLPRVAQENRLAVIPAVRPRIWLGNRVRVAPHYDVKENIACCVAGRRRFTLFPPGQIANLYPGPFELTPAGTPVSMVDTLDPDLAAHPRFAEAWGHAAQTTLEPGDAIYIPYLWWHGVESLDPLNVLVNYWWNEGVPEGVGGAYDALLHAILSFRHLPGEQRDAWRTMLDYYVFEDAGDPAAHLPPAARGVLGPPRPALFDRMREIIRGALVRN